MPQNPIFSIFRKKWKLRLWRQIKVANHLGPSWANGVPLGPKNGSKPSKITMPQNSNFRLPHGHPFFAKHWCYGYDAKSRWGPLRVHLGANGVPMDPTNGSKPYKITMPQNSNFQLLCGHRFFAKKSRLWRQCRWKPLGSILGPRGPIDFSQKMEMTIMAPIHGGDSLGSISRQMGSHWVQKMGRNRKKLPCSKIRIFDYPAVIDFSKKNGSYSYAAKSRWRTPKVHLGANGVPLGPKNWVKTIKNNHAPQFEFSTKSRSSIFGIK